MPIRKLFGDETNSTLIKKGYKMTDLVIYLHGFASGPLTSKAIYLKQELKKYNIGVIVPDLNCPNFSEMKIRNMVEVISQVVYNHREQNITIIASSLGVIPLLHYLKSNNLEKNCIQSIILLAPCFDFFYSSVFRSDIQPHLDSWKNTGEKEFYQSYYGRIEKLNFSFIEDPSQLIVNDIEVSVKTLILHGIDDEVIPYQQSIEYLIKNQSEKVKLVTIKTDHRFTNGKPQMWNEIKKFLNLSEDWKIDTIDLSKEEGIEQFKTIETEVLALLRLSYNTEFIGDQFHQNRILKERGMLFICNNQLSNKLLGCFYVMQDGKQTFIATDPDYRGKNIAKDMIIKSFDHFKYQYGEVRNHVLRNLLSSLGFQPITSFERLVERLGTKQKDLLEIRKINERLIYFRTNPELPHIFYEAEMLEKDIL